MKVQFQQTHVLSLIIYKKRNMVKILKHVWCGSLLETLSRSEVQCALCDDCSCWTKMHWLNLHFWKTTYIYKELTELHVRDVCVRTELCTRCPCWGRTANALMARVQNYDCYVCPSAASWPFYCCGRWFSPHCRSGSKDQNGADLCLKNYRAMLLKASLILWVKSFTQWIEGTQTHCKVNNNTNDASRRWRNFD